MLLYTFRFLIINLEGHQWIFACIFLSHSMDRWNHTSGAIPIMFSILNIRMEKYFIAGNLVHTIQFFWHVTLNLGHIIEFVLNFKAGCFSFMCLWQLLQKWFTQLRERDAPPVPWETCVHKSWPQAALIVNLMPLMTSRAILLHVLCFHT